MKKQSKYLNSYSFGAAMAILIVVTLQGYQRDGIPAALTQFFLYGFIILAIWFLYRIFKKYLSIK